jgi:phosphatidylserine/phosphatidylglycerophosphate/cardiolipin synthase-like enzyme
MTILKPSENIASIISLIENAKKSVVIVSPFNDLKGWDKLINAINKASRENIDVSYYVREGEGSKGIEELNVKIYEVPLLHAKMFFTEDKALISSGNLTNRPDLNWVYVLEKPEEYKELINFFQLYIKPLAKPFIKQ